MKFFNSRYVPIICAALLIAAFVVDMFTPQLLVIAILYNAPIALTSFATNRRLTAQIVVASLVADVVSGWFNGYREHQHWDPIALGDRVLAALSFILVGALSASTRAAAQSAAQLAARQQQAKRERTVREAFEAIGASVNREIVLRTLTRESLRVLQTDQAILYAYGAGIVGDEVFAAESGVQNVDYRRKPPEPQLASLIRRVLESGHVTVLTRADPMGRFVLDTLDAANALAVPLLEREKRFGVLLGLRRDPHEPFDADAEDFARAFAEQAGIALAQADLFLELASKNEALAAANAASLERNEIIRDIVYALSHDLRTPIAAARMTMQQALDGAYGQLPADYLEILRRTIASNADLARLAETLLMVARYESGEASTVRAPVALARLAEEVAAELRPLAQSRNVAIEVHTPAPDVRAAGDESELRRVMVNLLANAVTSTRTGGNIVLKVDSSNGNARITVDDDGFGIPEAQREALFQRFAPGARHGAGSGLGLYIVRRIAEGHGGVVRFEPLTPHGSSFVVELPAASLEHA